MKVAFIIMVHKEPKQVERLIKRLRHKSFFFYIHLDKKSSINDFAYLKELENVKFIKKRTKINWASYAMIEAYLCCMNEIIDDFDFDFISVISGQHYPIKPVEFIFNYLNNNKGKTFLEYQDQSSLWWDKTITWIENYHMTYFSFKGRYLIQDILNKVLPRRKLPVFNKLYGAPSSGWWLMSDKCVRYIISTMEREVRLRKFAKFTWGSDEYLFQTILLNSIHSNSIINDNLLYSDWSDGNANPKVLAKSDFVKLKNSKKLFARKFDENIDLNILNLIDQEILTSTLHS